MLNINFKYFVLGALLALVPLILYAQNKLKNNTQIEAYEYKSDLLTSAEIEGMLNPIATDSAEIEPTNRQKHIVYPTVTLVPDKVENQAKTATYVIRTQAAPEFILALIEKYSAEYKVSRDMMLGIAQCESGFREDAINGPYAGLYQFVSSTWASNRRAMELDTDPNLRLNAEEAVKTAAFKMNRDGYGAWPVCQRKAASLISANN